MQIVPIIYAHSTLPESMAFAGGAKEKRVPIDFILYCAETDGRRILIDAGCDTMPGFDMVDFVGPVAALSAHGIDKDGITDVIITHAHHDHIEGVCHFPRATIHIQKDEYERGKKYIPSGFRVNTFDEMLPLCEGVRVLKIGAHAVGSCIVELDGDDTTYVVSGDECYSRRCLDEYILTGSSVCPEKSRAFLEKYRAPEYTVLLCHENSPVR